MGVPCKSNLTFFTFNSKTVSSHCLISLFTRLVFSVVSQDYATRVNDFDVILGNSAIMKCEIPSFVTDFVSVINWSDNNDKEFYSSQNTMGNKKIKQKKIIVWKFNTSRGTHKQGRKLKHTRNSIEFSRFLLKALEL